MTRNDGGEVSEPIAWLVTGVGTRPHVTNDVGWAVLYDSDPGYVVTPLVAAPPEDGRPTYTELAEALRDARDMIRAARADAWDSDIVEQGINEGDYQAARMRERMDALLSRIPEEEG